MTAAARSGPVGIRFSRRRELVRDPGCGPVPFVKTSCASFSWSLRSLDSDAFDCTCSAHSSEVCCSLRSSCALMLAASAASSSASISILINSCPSFEGFPGSSPRSSAASFTSFAHSRASSYRGSGFECWSCIWNLFHTERRPISNSSPRNCSSSSAITSTSERSRTSASIRASVSAARVAADSVDERLLTPSRASASTMSIAHARRNPRLCGKLATARASIRDSSRMQSALCSLESRTFAASSRL